MSEGPAQPPKGAIEPIAVQIICNPHNLAEMRISHPTDRLATMQVLAHAIKVLAAHVAQHGNQDAKPGVEVAGAGTLRGLPAPEGNGHANRLKALP